jgi:hypothetical protein
MLGHFVLSTVPETLGSLCVVVKCSDVSEALTLSIFKMDELVKSTQK